MFEDLHAELLHARTTMQTVLGTGGPGGNGGAGGNALAIANSGVVIILDHSKVGALNVTNTDTGVATAAATGGAGGGGGNGGNGGPRGPRLPPPPARPPPPPPAPRPKAPPG